MILHAWGKLGLGDAKNDSATDGSTGEAAADSSDELASHSDPNYFNPHPPFLSLLWSAVSRVVIDADAQTTAMFVQAMSRGLLPHESFANNYSNSSSTVTGLRSLRGILEGALERRVIGLYGDRRVGFGL